MRMFIVFLICSMLSSCLETFTPESFGSVPRDLVIDATITDEVKQQRILLSRTRSLEEEEVLPEKNANVRVVDDMGNTYQFSESNPGEYISDDLFGAQLGRFYQLKIVSSSGSQYESEQELFEGKASLDSLYTERITSDLGNDGMAIYLDNSDPSGNARFYRFEYEETYKIIAPFWRNQDVTFVPNVGFVLVPRPLEELVCYATDHSTDILIENTVNLTENRLNRYLVRFINRNNYIISHRYSILVRVLVHSARANTYFETLNTLSSSETVFSENQTGFLNGNVFSTEDPAERVLGYFEVASVAEKRLFFNYEDFFPGEDLPDYVSSCQENYPESPGLIDRIRANSIKLLRENENPLPRQGPYVVVLRVCGDCTVLGTPKIPDFWID